MRLRWSALIAVLMSGATAAGAADKALDLKAECERVYHVYPLLMLAAMAEGPTGDHGRAGSKQLATGTN